MAGITAGARTKLRKLQAAATAKSQQQGGVAGAASGGAASTTAAASPHVKESYDAAEFEGLVQKYEKLNWRMISKPGGAVVRPDEFYCLYGFHMQVSIWNALRP
jgi:hypothetical protein